MQQIIVLLGALFETYYETQQTQLLGNVCEAFQKETHTGKTKVL